MLQVTLGVVGITFFSRLFIKKPLNFALGVIDRAHE